jgi:NitT/TauT family transport system permease protein
VALWAVAALFFPPYALPSPAAVVGNLGSYLDAEFLRHLGTTLYRVGVGFAMAFFAGTAVGVGAFALRKTQALNTLMIALQVVPGTILGIVLLLIFGVGSPAPIVLVATLTLPIVAVNTTNALARRDEALEGYLLASGGDRRDLVRYLYLPTLVPTAQSNLTIGFGMALKIAILGEFIGSQSGVGYLLNVARVYFDMEEVFFYLLVVLLVTLAFQIAQGAFFAALLEKYFYGEV